MRLRPGIVRPAVLRSPLEEANERKVTWLELFFDLAFVAAIGSLSTALAENFTPLGLLRFVAVTIPVWWGWAGYTFYLSRFDSDDLPHRLFTMLQIGLVCGVAIQIPLVIEGSHEGFARSYAALRFALVAIYFVAGLRLPLSRPLTWSYGGWYGFAALLWLGSSWVREPWYIAVWVLAIGIELATPWLSPSLAIRFPIDFSHIPERFGLFTIILLGEAILATIAGLRRDSLGSQDLVIGSLGVVFSFSIWWIYFEGVRGHQVKAPSDIRDVGKVRLWMFSHMLLAIGIIGAAVAFKLVLKHTDSSAFERQALVAGTGLCFLGMHSIYISGFNPELLRLFRRINWPHSAITTVIFLLIPFAGSVSRLPLTLIIVGAGVGHVLLTLREIPEVDVLLENARRRRMRVPSMARDAV